MTIRFADLARETTHTTGVGTYSLAGAAPGRRTFVAAYGGGTRCFYAAHDATQWEVGIGTITDSNPDTLSRDVILASSNGNAPVNWAAGAKEIYSVQPAAAMSYEYKPSVRVATVAPGLLTTSFAAGQVVDGVTLATGDAILIKNQTAAIENGIYTVNAAGAPTRRGDLPAGFPAAGSLIAVREGAVNADTLWMCVNNAGVDVTGTHGLTFAQVGTGAPSNAQYLTLAPDATLTQERVLTAGTNTKLTDAGPGGSATIAACTENVVLPADLTPPQIMVDQHNYNPAGLATAAILRLTSDTSRNITGIAGGVDGRLLIVQNVGTSAITLKNEHSGSDSNNRFALAADVTLAANQSAILLYDSTASRWRAISTPGGSGTLDIHGLAEGDPAFVDHSPFYSVSAAANRKTTFNKLLGLSAHIVNGRLTTESGVPCSTADRTNQGTIYFTPFRGNRVRVYDGTRWVVVSFSELSLGVSGGIYQIFDVFAFLNNGTLVLEKTNWNPPDVAAVNNATNATPIVITAPNHGFSNGDLVYVTGVAGNTNANGLWSIADVTANTFSLEGSSGNAPYTMGGTAHRINKTRSTPLATQDGVYVRSGDPTRLYLGTAMVGRTANLLDDSLRRRGLWNHYNRVLRGIRRARGNTHTYNVAAWRVWDRQPDQVNLEWVIGLAEDPCLYCVAASSFAGAAGQPWYCDVGRNDTNTVTIPSINAMSQSVDRLTSSFIETYYPPAGINFLCGLELGNATSAPTFVELWIAGLIQN